MIRIDYLNHASVLITIDKFKLLIDPWFFGTCFSHGWGLRYDNDEAFKLAETATHLWISHFHSDHFHVPTLKKILEINPNIIIIGNDSFNFKLNESVKSLGFLNVIPFQEREELKINDHILLIRYPTTGIDNMLLIKSKYGSILNYNDCNLPSFSQNRLSKKVKSVDIFMTNFNHAGKLLVYPPRDSIEIKQKLKANFKNNFKSFNVKYIFPFASHHYYKAPESFGQNSSLLSSEELLDIDDRILNIQIGDVLVYDRSQNGIEIRKAHLVENERKMLVRELSYNLVSLKKASIVYCETLRSNYWIFTKFLPDFFIEITDLALIVNLDIKRGLIVNHQAAPHVRVHSQALYQWFTTQYGTDSFIVGAHFEICNENKIPLKWQIVFGLLIDNKLSIKSILKMMFSLGGMRFLINRREEILGILLERKINADYHD